MSKYTIEYINEKEFIKLEIALRRYNFLAYKKLYFEYYPLLRNGEFVGEMTSQNKKDGTETYELKLPTDSMFKQVYGDVKLVYTVYVKEQTIKLNTITPSDILLDELTTYKGTVISKKNASNDMFKINLLNSMNK